MADQSILLPDSKPHYVILDGLRGVAALEVVIFHLLEIFAGGDFSKMYLNHGYLAVDFFFMLSGFVMGHAYNDRWNKMTLRQFFLRRLIRLQPMIIAGMLLGGIAFYFSDAPNLFPNVGQAAWWQLVLTIIIGCTLLPIPPSMEIRGWGEMHPLNGPAWSLFYEYVANICYALFIRKWSTTLLIIITGLAGVLLLHFATTNNHGDIIGGWSLNAEHIHIGLLRLTFPFLCGLLLHRWFKKFTIPYAFLWTSILLIGVLSFPRVGINIGLWANGLYDSGTIIFVFPIIIWLAAGGQLENKTSTKLCQWLGNISYPLYITHFPAAYVYYAYINNHQLTLEKVWPITMAVFFLSVILAHLFLKWYDEPVRAKLIAYFKEKKKI